MMTMEMVNSVMQEFFADYNSKDAEILRLREELNETRIKFERVSFELQKVTESKKRKNYGVRSFKAFGRTWYVATDVLADRGYSANTKSTLSNKVKLGKVRKFTYMELCDKIENAPYCGVYCIDETGAREVPMAKK